MEYNILIVEDEVGIRETIKDIMSMSLKTVWQDFSCCRRKIFI